MLDKDIKMLDEQNTMQENIEDLIDEIDFDELYEKVSTCSCCCSSHGGGKARYE